MPVITLAGRPFTGPFLLPLWSAPRTAGLYAVMVPGWRLLTFRALHFGQAEDFSAREFLTGHPRYREWLAIAGTVTAWYLYLKNTELPKRIAAALGPLYVIVERKYGFDELYSRVFSGGALTLGQGFWKGGDQKLIDGLMVNGSARLIGWFAGVVRLVQSGFIYHYAFFMIIGVSMLLTYFIFFRGTLVP